MPFPEFMMFDINGLLRYYFTAYSRRTTSIFLDGLMGGMFLEYLLDTEEKCAEREFIKTFLYIAIGRYSSTVIQDMGDYAKVAAAVDGRRTKLERLVQRALPYLLHLLRLVQFPLLALLTYEVSKLLVEEMKGGARQTFRFLRE